jgi:hypothetical protein
MSPTHFMFFLSISSVVSSLFESLFIFFDSSWMIPVYEIQMLIRYF